MNSTNNSNSSQPQKKYIYPPIRSIPTENRNIIYVSDLPMNTLEEDLKQFFSNYIENIRQIQLSKIPNQLNKNINLYARIFFDDSEIANKARIDLNLRKLKNHSIRLMWDDKEKIKSHNNPVLDLFIKNIPLNVSAREFYEFFLQFGDIFSAKLNQNEEGNYSGYGYITYYMKESADEAIKNCDGKVIWGATLEVKHFEGKNYRIMKYGTNTIKIYVTNFPANFNADDIKNFINQFGETYSIDIYNEISGKKYALVTYKNLESANNAIKNLNGKNLNGYEIFAEIFKQNYYQHNNDFSLKKNNYYNKHFYNQQINDQYKNCNLLIKNIPYTVNEQKLKEIFEKFGEIKSVKIEKITIMQPLQNGELREIPTSKGYGYILFENSESAAKAIETYNDRFLPGYESWNKTLIINYFIPKSELINKNYNNNIVSYNYIHPYNQMFYQNYRMQKFNNYNKKRNNNYYNNNYYNNYNNNYNNNNDEIDNNQFDLNAFNNCQTEEEKKEYLGENIFKLIEEHPLAQEKKLKSDNIGKITGMILDIKDMNEIVNVCQKSSKLTEYLKDALSLLNI